MPTVWLVLAIAGAIGAVIAVTVAAVNVMTLTGPALFFTALSYAVAVLVLSVATGTAETRAMPLWALRLGLPLLGLAITWGTIWGLMALL